MIHQVLHLDPAGRRFDGGSGDGDQDDSRSVDELVIGPDPSAPTHRLHRWLLVVTVLCSFGALTMTSGPGSLEPGALELLVNPLNILVLGDSSADPEVCKVCSTYVDQSAAAWSQHGRRRVRLDRKTVPSDLAAPSMSTLVESLRSDPDIRDSVSEADVILLAIGSGDVATTAAASCGAERQAPWPCPEVPVAQFGQSLASWITAADTIRDHRPMILRVVTPPPTSGLPRHSGVARTACQVAAAHAADCVNVYQQARTNELVADPGSDPQHPQLTQHGHDIVAAQLIAAGITPDDAQTSHKRRGRAESSLVVADVGQVVCSVGAVSQGPSRQALAHCLVTSDRRGDHRLRRPAARSACRSDANHRRIASLERGRECVVDDGLGRTGRFSLVPPRGASADTTPADSHRPAETALAPPHTFPPRSGPSRLARSHSPHPW